MTVNAVATVPRSVFVDGQAPAALRRALGSRLQQGSGVPVARSVRARREERDEEVPSQVSEYRWPIYLGALLAMSVISSGVLVWVATRPDSPRPIKGYYEAARAWDADEAVEDASRQLGWTRPLRVAVGHPPLRGHAAAGGRPRRRPRWNPVSGLARPPVRHAAVGHAPQPERRSSSRSRSARAATGPSSSSTSQAPGNCGSTRRRTALRFVHAARVDGRGRTDVPTGRRPRDATAQERRVVSAAPPGCAHCGLAVPGRPRARRASRAVLLQRVPAGLHARARVGIRPVLPARRTAAGHARARARHGPQLRGLRRRAAAGRGHRGRSAPTAAARGSISKACTAPPACGSSNGCRPPCRASTRCA